MGGDPHAAPLVLDQVGDLVLGEREPVERGARVLDEQRACGGQLRPAARAVDERRADLGLERRQVLRDRGLREVERVGRAGQRSVVGDRTQRAQAPEVVHKWSLSLVRKACLNLWSVAATVWSMFTPTHTTITAIRRLVENGGPQPRTRTSRRSKRV